MTVVVGISCSFIHKKFTERIIPLSASALAVGNVCRETVGATSFLLSYCPETMKIERSKNGIRGGVIRSWKNRTAI